MNNGTITMVRRAAILGCAALVAWGAWSLKAAADPFEDAEAALDARLERYVELRLQGDWLSLYELTDPLQRRTVELRDFLDMYGHGALRVTEMKPVDKQVDMEARTAHVTLHMIAELVPAKLPPRFRASLRVDDPSALRQESDFELDWAWRDGEWYFGMDGALVSGQDPESGRAASAVGTRVGPAREGQ